MIFARGIILFPSIKFQIGLNFIEKWYIIVSENNETKEQIWSDLIEVNNIMDLDFSVEFPIENVTSEFLVDLVGA